MDAQEYDRIADLLIQIAKKIQNLNCDRIPNITRQSEMHHHLLEALKLNHELAEFDAMGWL
jgi:hypothetical protein